MNEDYRLRLQSNICKKCLLSDIVSWIVEILGEGMMIDLSWERENRVYWIQTSVNAEQSIIGGVVSTVLWLPTWISK